MCSICSQGKTSFLGHDFPTLFKDPIDHEHAGPLLIDGTHAGEAFFDRTFAHAVEAEQLRYVVVEGTPGIPFGPWRALAGQLTKEIEGLDEPRRRVFGNLLNGRDPSLPVLSMHHALYRTFDAFRQLLDNGSKQVPLAILIHRIDRLDTPSIELLRFLSPFLAEMRVFVGATVEPGNDEGTARIRDLFPRASIKAPREIATDHSTVSVFKVAHHPGSVHSITPDGAAEAGASQWQLASVWARSVGATEFAAECLKKTVELTTDVDVQWDAQIDLIKIYAESNQADKAEMYLSSFLQHEKTTRVGDDKLSGLMLELSDAGLNQAQLAPLVRDLSRSRADLTVARIQLLEPPQIASVSSGRVTQGRWLGANQKATRIVREQGTEEDFARTLYVYDWWSKEDLDAMLAVSSPWQSLSGRSRALSVAAETLMYRYGEFERACALLEEQAQMHIQNGWIEEQAKSLVRLSMALLANGELDRAEETRARARETVWRLGPSYLIYEHAGTKSGGDLYPEISMESNFAWYREGDWLAVAEHWAMAVAMHEGAGSPVHIVEAAMTAQAFARLGRFDDARTYLDELMAILPKLQPRDWAFNGAIGRASHAIWDMLDKNYAQAFLEFTEALLSNGVGDWTNTSLELSGARMATLLGKHDLAQRYFSEARECLNEHQTPQRGIVDFDEAIALRLEGNSQPERRDWLLDSAIKCFTDNHMDGWLERAEQEARN
jgi:tetratricopeptide (TPR) repeat protein